MGAIFGAFKFDKQDKVDPSLLDKMSQVLIHRGPDGQGMYVNKNIGIGGRWVNIDDSERDNQPCHNEDKTIWVVLDGEIAESTNWKKFLEEKGHRLDRFSGAEILLHLYEEFGEDFVEKIRGEFAFALWDQKEQKLLLGRDNAAFKPLHYLLKKREICFGSEIKAILQDKEYERKINFESLGYFLTYCFVPWPGTLFKDIKQVPPAHILICHKGRIKVKPYWQFMFRHARRRSEKYYSERLYELMEDSVRIRLERDIPVGAFLSGGLDSSTLVGLISIFRPVKTFSVGFREETHNELPDARITAKHYNTEHHEVIVGYATVKDFLPKMIWYTDQPFFNSAAIATYYGARLAGEHVKVIFDAHGPDQLLGGFGRYICDLRGGFRRSPLPDSIREKYLERLTRRIDLDRLDNSFIDKIKTKLKRLSIPYEERVLMERTAFGKEARKNLCAFDIEEFGNPIDYLHLFFQKVKDCTLLEKLLYWDTMHMVYDDLMVKVDRMTMANSLETKLPFMDVKLMDFIGTIPSNLKIKGFMNPTLKYIFKKSMSELLPSYTLKKKKKWGFQMPLNYWMKNQLKDFVHDILLDSRTLNRDYFNRNYVENMVRQFYQGDGGIRYTSLWALVVFEMWHRIFIDK